MLIKFKSLSIVITLSVLVLTLASWGVWGHEHINRGAIFALPEPMRSFYYNHADFITVESTGPDMKKSLYNDRSEGPKHFIDAELFNVPLDSLPKTPVERLKTIPDSVVQKNGSLPWQIQDVMNKLTKAFKERRKSEILLLSADLGHYLGDAHMPLHTSANYDGQLTKQNGVHALWEARLPEQFGNSFNFYVRDAKYIDDVTTATWTIIKNSHTLVDTVLAAEMLVRKTLPEDKWYKKDEQGNLLKTKYNTNIHSDEYAVAFNKALNGMVERQMRASIVAVADFWYTAWVNAGKPDLSGLDDKEVTEQNKSFLTKDYEAWKKGKLVKMSTDLEY